MDFPVGPLAMAFQFHSGPRILRANKCLSRQIEGISASVLPGCTLSGHLVRVLLYHVLEEAHRRFELNAPFQFVDDLAAAICGDEK